MRPDHQDTLGEPQHDLEALFIIGVCLFPPPPKAVAGFIHNIWASSLTGKIMRPSCGEAMETENDVGGLSTGLWTLPNGMFFSKEHSGCK